MTRTELERTLENRNRTLNVAKGIGIFLVIYGHLIQRHMVALGQDFFLNPVFRIIYMFHMPLFVFISGYLLASSLSRSSKWKVFQSRARGLMIPFLCWGILGVLITIALDGLDHQAWDWRTMPWVFWDQLILNPAIWFLWTLFGVAALALGNVFAGFFILFFPINQYVGLYYIQWFYVFFACGFFVYRLKMNWEAPYVKFGFVGCVILFVVLQQFWNTTDYIYVNKMMFANFGDVVRLLYRYLMGFLGIVVVMGISWQLSKASSLNFLEKVGMYSLDIYLIQRFLLEGLYGRLIIKWQIPFNYFYVTIMAVLFIVGLMALSNVLIRKNKILTMLLLGSRK